MDKQSGQAEKEIEDDERSHVREMDENKDDEDK